MKAGWLYYSFYIFFLVEPKANWSSNSWKLLSIISSEVIILGSFVFQ